MKKSAYIILSAILSLTMCSCSQSGGFSDSEILSKDITPNADITQTYNYSEGATTAPNSYNTYSNLITNFELKLFRNKFEQSKNQSFVFSPALTTLDLSLLANGASGDTRQEILLSLGGDLSVDDLNQCSSYFKSRMEAVSQAENNKTEEKTDLSSEHVLFSNNFFINEGSEIASAFLQKNADFFGSNMIRFKFTDEKATEKISNLFSDFNADAQFSIPADGSLFGISSAQITDTWLSAAENSDSLLHGKTESAYFTSPENYTSTDNAEGIIKYTAKNPLKMLFIVPKNGSLEDYIKDFSETEYLNLIENMDITKKVDAQIPQFSIPSSNEPVALSPVLKKSGLYTLFTDSAKFQSMNFSSSLKLDELYELEPSISVGANGISCKANAANTAKQINTPNEQVNAENDNSNQSDTTFTLDKSFIFMLIDNESSIPVYIGVNMIS